MTMVSELPAISEELLAARYQLISDVRFYPRQLRGRTWFLVTDPLSQKQLLIDQPAYLFLRHLERGDPVGVALSTLAGQGHDLTEHDILSLITHLVNSGLVRGEKSTDARSIGESQASSNRARRLQQWLTPFSIRLPIVDPDRILNKLMPLARYVFTLPVLMATIVLFIITALQVIEHWRAIELHWTTRFTDPGNVLWVLVVYPLVKVLHELGHGLAAKRWGAEVHEMGIMLLVFMPVPYVDASSSNLFSLGRHRMTVAAAGILVELILSSLAILCWLPTEPGLLKDILFNVAVIGGISTLLFNGNPLLRFDGYYVLSDALQIPNLGPRASAYLGYLFRRYILGLDSSPPASGKGDAGWLFVYGVASGIYRTILSITIALYVAGKFFIFGVLLALWFILFSVARPWLNAIRRTTLQIRSQRKMVRAVVTTGILVIVLPTLIFTVPIPRSTVAYGLIVPSDTATVRADTDGFIIAVAAKNGTQVTAGETLYVLGNDDLGFQLRDSLAARDELTARFRGTLGTEPAQSARWQEKITSNQAVIKELRRQIDGLTVTSETGGIFSRTGSGGVTGTYVHKGDVLGFISGSGDRTGHVMISQDSIDLVRHSTFALTARSVAEPLEIVSVHLLSEVPQATSRLPGRSLGTAAGGVLAVDARDTSGIQLITPMFQVTVGLPGSNLQIGQTILVRFLHSYEPIGTRIVRRIQRLLSAQFAIR